MQRPWQSRGNRSNHLKLCPLSERTRYYRSMICHEIKSKEGAHLQRCAWLILIPQRECSFTQWQTHSEQLDQRVSSLFCMYFSTSHTLTSIHVISCVVGLFPLTASTWTYIMHPINMIGINKVADKWNEKAGWSILGQYSINTNNYQQWSGTLTDSPTSFVLDFGWSIK